ncbi:hypothetical protein HB950_02650 [Listeria welshimeri]|nr:hypothetical protein [Listeria welshimeri]
MCEYCEENFRKRGEITTDEGHEIRIDWDNDLAILLDIDYKANNIYLDIKYCPWCGRKLEGKEK